MDGVESHSSTWWMRCHIFEQSQPIYRMYREYRFAAHLLLCTNQNNDIISTGITCSLSHWAIKPFSHWATILCLRSFCPSNDAHFPTNKLKRQHKKPRQIIAIKLKNINNHTVVIVNIIIIDSMVSYFIFSFSLFWFPFVRFFLSFPLSLFLCENLRKRCV